MRGFRFLVFFAFAASACSSKEHTFVCPTTTCGEITPAADTGREPDTTIDTASDSGTIVPETGSDTTAVDTTALDTTAVDSKPMDAPTDTVVVDSVADTPLDAGSVFDPTCVDTVSGTGTRTIATAIDDFVPLCNGTILYGDKATSEVVLTNLVSGTTIRKYALTAAPTGLDYDAARGKLWVVHGATKVSRIDLMSGSVTEITMPFAAHAVAVGPDGKAFVSTAKETFDTQIQVIDATASTIAKAIDLPGVYQSRLAWDETNSQLFLVHKGLSPSNIHRYAFDATAVTLTKKDTSSKCSNGIDIAVSRDGKHLGVACGGGNGTGYTVWDFDPLDLTKYAGEWNTGAYPSGAAFSPDSAYFGGTNRDELLVFNAVTHGVVGTAFKPTSCPYGGFFRTLFSRGGKMLIAHSDCGFDDDTSLFAWRSVP
jgi:hypothetical protein